MSLYERWDERETVLESKTSVIGSGIEGKVFYHNDLEFKVWENGLVTVKRRYNASSDPRQTFPNMTVTDGVLNIPVEDVAGMILSRLTPAELADGLMEDDETRAQLVDRMASRYSAPGFDERDRREFLAKVQQEVFAESLDRAVAALNNAEEVKRCQSSTERWKKAEAVQYRRLWEWVERFLPADQEARRDFTARFNSPDQVDSQAKILQDPAQVQSVGEQWRDSRDYWRKVLLDKFGSPPDPVPEEKSDVA